MRAHSFIPFDGGGCMECTRCKAIIDSEWVEDFIAHQPCSKLLEWRHRRKMARFAKTIGKGVTL